MIRVGTNYRHLLGSGGCACHSPQIDRVTQRLTAFNRRGFLAGLAGAAAIAGLPGPALAQAPSQGSSAPGKLLFRRVRLFDGKADSLRDAPPSPTMKARCGCARATNRCRGFAIEARRRGRRVVAAQPARHDHVQRGGARRGGWRRPRLATPTLAAHACAPQTIKRAVAAGVACIEHAHLMDDEAAQMMADKGVWPSIQPFLSEADVPPMSGPSRDKALEVIAATPARVCTGAQTWLKTAFGSDLLFSAALTPRQGRMLAHLARWHSNADVLKMATSVNGELLALSNKRSNPYPDKLGLIEAGAYADLLVFDGNPLETIDLVATPETSLALIMKDGVPVRNVLPA